MTPSNLGRPLRNRSTSWNSRTRLALSRASLTLLAMLVSACASGKGAQRARGAAAGDSIGAMIAAERGGTATNVNAIGVTPFQLGASDRTLTALGYALADLLTTDLARSGKLQLVERSRLGEVLQELDLTRSGRIDSATAPRAGRLMRAHQLVLGSLDTLPNGELRLSLRLANVETGLLEQAIDARAPINDILAAEKAIAFRLFDALGVTLTPAERSVIETRPATSLAALIAYGRGVQAELVGDRRRAADEFQQALRIDASFGAASERATQLKAAGPTASASMLTPGLRAIDAPVAGTVDRLNRPLDLVTSLSRPQGGAGDPAFPSTAAVVVITIRRP